jgi:hypothetical protein
MCGCIHVSKVLPRYLFALCSYMHVPLLERVHQLFNYVCDFHLPDVMKIPCS